MNNNQLKVEEIKEIWYTVPFLFQMFELMNDSHLYENNNLTESHANIDTMIKKIKKSGYNWNSIKSDCVNFLNFQKNCLKCNTTHQKNFKNTKYA